MKRKLFIIPVFFMLISCDFSVPISIESGKEYSLSTECGSLRIRGSSMATIPIILGCSFNGNYEIDMSSLKLVTTRDDVKVTVVDCLYNSKNTEETKFQINGSGTLSFSFKLEAEKPFRRKDVIVLFCPSDFILCEGKPIITDTVRIRLRN